MCAQFNREKAAVVVKYAPISFSSFISDFSAFLSPNNFLSNLLLTKVFYCVILHLRPPNTCTTNFFCGQNLRKEIDGFKRINTFNGGPLEVNVHADITRLCVRLLIDTRTSHSFDISNFCCVIVSSPYLSPSSSPKQSLS